MVPPRTLRDYLVPQSAPERPGPTIEAWKQRIPAIEDTRELGLPQPRQPMTREELENMVMDVSTPMGLAGSVRKVGAKAASDIARELADRIPNLWHGTKSGPFPKFLREYFGRGSGGNRLGLAGYGTTERMPEGLNYIKAQTQGAPSSLITGKGSEIEITPELATQLRAGEQTVEGYIDALKNTIARNEEIARGAAIDSPFRRIATSAVESDRSQLRNMLTAYDEGVAEIRRPGTLIEFTADVDPQKLLQYDKDLIDQTPFVQEAMRSVLGIRGAISPRSPNQLIDFNRFLRTSLPDAKGTAKLESAGVQGVVGRSPSSSNKAMNYAIFDPERISILRYLGMAGLLGGGAAASRQPSEQPLAPSSRMR